jgi:DNA-binding NarL/FixJ family response regulator
MDAAVGLGLTLVVDDDGAMLQRLMKLVQALDVPCVARGVRTLAEAREVALSTPGLQTALIDLGLPDGHGVDLIAWFAEQRPEVTCVVVSAWSDEHSVLVALRAGAVGYLLKERDDDELRLALLSMARGGAPIDPFVARGILALLARPAAAPTTKAQAAGSEPAAMSPREMDVLRLVAQGHSNRDIATSTGLSRLTIESYTKSIYRKLAVGSRTAAVFAARTQGLLD